MPKNKATTALAVQRLNKVIPKATLELQRKEIDSIVKKTPDNELHTTFVKAKGFFKLFESATKDEFVGRAKKAFDKGEKISTDVGDITFVSRSNFSFDFDGIDKFLGKTKLNEELIYDYSYTVNTRDAKVLSNLIDKGYVIKKKTINTAKLNALAEVHPELLNFVENNPTEFVKGL